MENIDKKLLHPNTTMTEQQLKELKKRVSESLSLIRQRVLTRQPFTGGILMRLEIIPVRDCMCNTALTDGSRIFFDIDFYTKLNDNQRMFVLAHEVWHVVYMHFLRQQTRKHDIWNIASDCEINRMLKEAGFISPPDVCYPEEKVKDKSAEEIYEYILKKYKNVSNYFQSLRDNNNSNKNSNNGGDGEKYPITGQFDEHITNQKDNKPTKIPSDQWGEKGFDPDFKPYIESDIAEKIRESVISEAQRYERTQGTLPEYITRVIDKIRKPEINWREYLTQFVTSCIGDRRVWLPPNRHHVWSGNYFQSRRGESINVIVTVDTSGSTTADLPKFMSELISLIETFGNYELTIIQCDATVQDISSYDSFNEFPIEEIKNFKWKGFGGSDLRPAFDEILKMNTEATFHIVFTDGYISTPDKNPLNIPTLFVLTQDGNESLCNWGEKVKFKESVDN
jgi:predicted metal-dependent peptidase